MIEYPKISELAWNISEKEYRDSNYLSYSLLSGFAKNGPKYLLKEEREDTESLRFGSLVDNLLTGSENIYSFYDKNIPEKIKLIIENIYSSFSGEFARLVDVPDEIILSAANLFDFYTNYKDETRVKKISLWEDYWDFVNENRDRIIISKDMFINAQKCVDELKINEWTRGYFIKPQLNKSIELHFQQKFKFLRFKCMVDIILIDHEHKKIQLIDLKTTSDNELKFNDSFYKWGYYIQSQLYTYIVKELIKAHPEFKEYKLLPFKFVCINKNGLSPVIWEDNRCFSIVEREYKGDIYESWCQLVERYDWHMSHNKFKYPIEAYQQNGIMKLI